MRTCDCIVIGIGGVGSAVVESLARRGVSAIGFEQFGPVHDRGSSHGETRIIRKAYFEHPDYVPLLHRAFDAWRELEVDSGRELLQTTGLLISGPAAGPAVRGTIAAADEHQLPLEVLSPDDADHRFPEFNFPPHHHIAYEREAGYLHVERCVAAQIEAARAHGAELLFNERVHRWKADESGVTVETGREKYKAASLVIAAGPWSGELLAGLGVSLRVLRKVQLWFEIPPNTYQRSPGFFVEHGDGDYYGIPSPGGAELKIAEHSGEETVSDPLHVDRGLYERDVGRIQAFIKAVLPAVRPASPRHAVCMYTMSPDGHFLLDRHPTFPQVTFAAGLSGHGFKFVRVLGEALADFVIDGSTPLPVDFLRLKRLAGRTATSF
jgi:monomeric sarcosine oxidase